MARRTAEPPISWLMRIKLERPRLISLAAGFTDNATLPVAGSRRLLNELLGDTALGQAALQYGSTAGDAKLRNLTARRIRQLDGNPRGQAASYEAKRTVITHGSQQFLYMATEALCDPGDIVLVEDPTYFVYLGIMQSRGVAGRGVRINRDGIDLGDYRRAAGCAWPSGFGAWHRPPSSRTAAPPGQALWHRAAR